MFEIYKKRISKEKFFKDAKSLSFDNKTDFISYKEFITYFNNLEIINKHSFIIAANFSYGWMPTILNFRSNEFNKAIEILNNAKQGKIPNQKELKILKELINNSLVGTAKLLHFINPNVFAIWDSRVYRYLTGNEPYDYRIGNYNAFLDYLKFCKYLINQDEFSTVHRIIEKKIGYSLTPLRVVELVMYSKGNKTSLN